MRAVLIIIFLSVSSLVLGKNKMVENYFFNAKEKKVIIPVKKKAKMMLPKTMLAFEYYYTIEWLYAETPFSHKLDAYV